MDSTRPKSILWFEWLYLATIPVGLLRIAIAATERGADWPLSLPMPVLVLAIPLLLALRVSRRRSGLARWMLTGWFAIWMAAVSVAAVASGGDNLSGESLIVIALQAAGIGLLFTPSARAWLARRSEAVAAPKLKGIFE